MDSVEDRENQPWINRQVDKVAEKLSDTLGVKLTDKKPDTKKPEGKSQSEGKAEGKKEEAPKEKVDSKESTSGGSKLDKSTRCDDWMDKLKNKNLWRPSGFINGEFVSSSGSTFDVTNPSDGSLLVSLPRMTADDANNACEIASKAFKSWKKTTGLERSKYLRKMAELMCENIDDLALIMTMESGKPLEEAKAEIEYAKAFYEWFAEEAKRFNGEVLQPPTKGKRLLTIKQPIGVCGLLAPWNFPSAMITRKVGPALAAGCTVVIKPSSETPMSALALCAIAEMAELPAGVMNCLTVFKEETKEVGQALCRSEIVRKVSSLPIVV
jgi:succinate-semialdehyde dehydrogenase/glutarate-semialdehyde dehydrogenase